jgi:hypothetical protein
MKKIVVVARTFFVLSLVASYLAASHAAERPPNFVIIFTDDQG